MSHHDPLVSLRCAHCNEKSVLGREALIERLRDIGMLLRETKPEWELLMALLEDSAEKLVCDECERPGHVVEVLPREDQTDWGDGKRCAGCGCVISPERLEVFPDTEFCPTCQSQADRGGTPGAEVEYCPLCGDIMEIVRATGSGLARYVMRCRGCKR